MAPGQPNTRRPFSSVHKTKEPKFVPYEPYRAAITPLVAPTSKKREKKDSLKKKSSTNSIESHTEENTSLNETNNSLILQEQIVTTTAVKEEKNDNFVIQTQPTFSTGQSIIFASPKQNDIDEKSSYVMAERENSYKEEIEKLKKELEEQSKKTRNLEDKLSESEKQNRVQTQINSEVKKLLVASVGEDIEAKVDYLTQDKARLAADIRQFSHQISKDFEEKEKLSVESDVWKSKFLACR